MVLVINKHKKALLDLLVEIYSDRVLSGSLGFKGGTAALLFYGLDRFSVDLDFDLLVPSKEKTVFDRLKTLSQKAGTLKESYKKRNTLLFIVSYGEPDQNLKLEVSLRSFGSKYSRLDFLGVPMLVMNREDMFAHKLAAMTERLGKASRDIYDVGFFLRHNWPLNLKMLEKRVKMAPRIFLNKSAADVAAFPEKNVLSGIGELLDAKQKARVKKNLIAETSAGLLALSASLE